jgi:mycothiol synthase
MTGSLAIRPYAAADDAAVIEVLARATTGDGVALEQWRAFVALSFNNGGRDFLVAAAGEALVAVATSTLIDGDPPRRHFRITVDPAHRRSGVGTAILAAIATQQRPPGCRLQSQCMDSWESGVAFLRAHGFTPSRREHFMQWFPEMPTENPPPAGVTLRPGSATDDAAWVRLHEVGFRGADYTPLSPADLEVERADRWFALHVAESAGDVVGFCHTRSLGAATDGLLNSVVVAPAARGLGVGRALVAAGLQTLARCGATRVELNVDADNTAAIKVYERLGFVTYDDAVTWVRPL